MNDPIDPADPADAALDARLRRTFAPPPADVFARIGRDAQRAAPTRWRPWALAGAAAGAVAVAAAAALVLAWLGGRTPPAPVAPATEPAAIAGADLGALWVAAYRHAVAHGGRNGACCDPHSDFGRSCQQRFAVRIGVGDPIDLSGCYCGLPTGECVAAIASTPAGLVGVFAVARRADPQPTLPAHSGLHLERRELGELVLYALSAQPAGRPLDAFRIEP